MQNIQMKIFLCMILHTEGKNQFCQKILNDILNYKLKYKNNVFFF